MLQTNRGTRAIGQRCRKGTRYGYRSRGGIQTLLLSRRTSPNGGLIGGFSRFFPMMQAHYKGSSQAEIDLSIGEVQFMIDSTPAALPNIRAGRTRALATTGARRLSGLADVPTVIESGLPRYESVSWWGIIGPAGMKPDVVSRLNGEIAK